MLAYSNQHKGRYGVEPICRLLPIAPSTYHDATRRPGSARAVRDRQLKVEIIWIHAEHFGVYGARTVWRQLHREGSRWPAAPSSACWVSWGCVAPWVARPAGPPRRMRPPPDPRTW